MKNKTILLFFVINISMVATPIFAVWDDIFSWVRHRTFSASVADDISHENNEKSVAIVVKEPKESKEKEEQNVQKNVAHDKQDKIENKQNWDPKKVAAVVGLLTLTCFFNVKAMLGMIVLAYLVRQNADYINESGAGKVIDGFVEKGMQVIKSIL